MSTLDLAVGARVRDKRSGAVGTYQGTAYVAAGTPGGGGRTLPLLHWDGTGNAVPWGWSTDALEALETTPCEECGQPIPDDAPSMVDAAHAPSCSLHPGAAS